MIMIIYLSYIKLPLYVAHQSVFTFFRSPNLVESNLAFATDAYSNSEKCSLSWLIFVSIA